MMEDSVQEQKFCENCKKDVSAANFVMHTAHCFRNISLCKICKEPFPKSDLEKHITEAHAKIKCVKCGDEIEHHDIEEHDNKFCAKRLVKCCFCEMEVTANNQDDHEDYCGSRTERCDGCGQYVMVKFLDIHNSNNHVFLTMEDLDKHCMTNGVDDVASINSRLKNFHSSKDDKEPLLLRSRSSPGKRTNDMPQINVNAHNERRKETIKPIFNEELDVRRSNPSLSDASKMSIEQLDRLLSLHMMENEFRDENSAEDPLDPFVGHLGNSVSRYPPFQEFTDHTLAQEWRHSTNSFGSNEFRQPISSSEQNKCLTEVVGPTLLKEDDDMSLPCEFCNELFPSELLLDHQRYCQINSLGNRIPRPPENSLLNKQISSEMNNLRGLKNKNKKEPATILNDFSKRPDVFTEPTSDDIQDMIPCEYCGELFKSDSVILHQSRCSGISDVGVEGLTDQVTEDEELSSLPPIPPFPKEDPMKWNSFAEEMRRQKYQWNPDADYLEELFLKEAIENSLKDKVAVPPSSETEHPPLANLSLKSPKVRHVPIEVSPDYGLQRRQMIYDDNEVSLNNIREAKAQYANSGSPLVLRTRYEARHGPETSLLNSTNATSSRHHSPGARPKFTNRVSNEQSNAFGSRRDSQSRHMDEIPAGSHGTFSMPENHILSTGGPRESVPSTTTSTNKPVAPRRSKTRSQHN